jgi:hypothetical protein
MPALGFAGGLEMTVRLEYLSLATETFRPIPGAVARLSAGTASTGTHQAGASFSVTSPAIVSATIQFAWTRGGRVLGRVTRSATGHRRGVMDGRPPGFSASVCRLGE